MPTYSPPIYATSIKPGNPPPGVSGVGTQDPDGYFHWTIWLGSGDDTYDKSSATNADYTIVAGDGNDTVYTGTGDDLIFGENGDDYISAGDGNDRLYGEAGNDKLFGGKGNDFLSGGANDDTLTGGWGSDTMWGGGGKDTFVVGFSVLDHGDVIKDFAAADDSLDMSVAGSASNYIEATLPSGHGYSDVYAYAKQLAEASGMKYVFVTDGEDGFLYAAVNGTPSPLFNAPGMIELEGLTSVTQFSWYDIV